MSAPSGALALLLVLSATGGAASDDDLPERATDRTYSPWKLEDLEALADVLKRHVAFLEITTIREHESIEEPSREGYGAVIGPRRVAALSFLVEGARSIAIHGPGKKKLDASIVLFDAKRRVAILETRAPLEKAGLRPAAVQPRAEREVDQSIYALVATLDRSGVIHGTVTNLGDEEEYEGHPRIDLRLTRGMPIFDEKARLVGYARTVAWDVDPFMIVPVEMIEAARTATTAASIRSRAAPKETESPWWVR